MGLYSKLAGIIGDLFQFDKGDGPLLKSTGGVIEARNAADAAYAIVRGASPVAGNDLVTKSYGDANYGGGGGTPIGRRITVATSGGDYTSVAAAVTAAAGLSPVPSATDPVVIEVYPGIYSEPAFTLATGMHLRGVGGYIGVEIQAQSTTAKMITMQDGTTLSGFTLRGASSAGGCAILVDGAGVVGIEIIEIRDCHHGLEAINGATVLAVNFNIRRVSGEVLGHAIHAASAGRIRIDGVNMTGEFGAAIGAGIHVNDGFVSLAATYFDYCDKVALVEGDSRVELFSSVVLNADTAFHITNTGSGQLRLNNVDFSGPSTTWDLLVESPTALVRLNGPNINQSKISLPSGFSDIFGFYHSEYPGDEALQVRGELHVGTPDDPYESVFGNGESYTNGMRVLTNTNGEAGTWDEQTTAAASHQGSTFFAFPGTAANNALYIGGPRPFQGLELTTAVAGALGAGSWVLEYWDGSAWTAALYMATLSASPYTQYAQTSMTRAQDEQIRFGRMTGWATKSLNSISAYWVRFRITSTVTTRPQIEQIKLAPHRTQIKPDGFVEFFGDARKLRSIPGFSLASKYEVAGFLLLDEDIRANVNTSIIVVDNQFSDTAVDAIGMVVPIPDGLDTSLPVSVRVAWAPLNNAAGFVEWHVGYTVFYAGDLLNNSLPESLVTVVTAAPGTQHQVAISTLEFTIPTALPGGFIAVRLYRDGTPGNADDTYAEHVYVASLQMNGYFWA